MAEAKPYETLDMDRDVTVEGKPTPYLEQFIYSLQVLLYDGTPEGNVSATPGSLCMNKSGTAGSILYIKKSGTGNTGWLNVA